MKEKRYYYDGNITVNKTVILEGEEAHHLTNVMRTRVGERVCLFNGNGTFYFGNVEEINKKNVVIFVTESEISKNEPNVKIDLFQALAKGDKLSLIMQKITELGASNMFLFESDFCDVKANSNKKDRMDLISIAAAKQCGRARIVGNDGIFTVRQVAEKILDYDKFFVAYENESGETLADYLLNCNEKLENVAIMIGAEGGFSESEIELLKNNGAKIVSLGRRILRTETASIACVALLSQILDR